MFKKSKALFFLILFFSNLKPSYSSVGCINHYKWSHEYLKTFKWSCVVASGVGTITSAWLWDNILARCIATTLTVDTSVYVGISAVLESKMKYLYELFKETQSNQGGKPKLHEFHNELSVNLSFKEMERLLYLGNELKLFCQGHGFPTRKGKIKQRIEEGSLSHEIEELLSQRRRRELFIDPNLGEELQNPVSDARDQPENVNPTRILRQPSMSI